jgi:hypothetical protein
MENELLLNAQEVSDKVAQIYKIKLSKHCLAVHRNRGSGPCFYRPYGMVYYKFSDVESWLKHRLSPRRYSGKIVYLQTQTLEHA